MERVRASQHLGSADRRPPMRARQAAEEERRRRGRWWKQGERTGRGGGGVASTGSYIASTPSRLPRHLTRSHPGGAVATPKAG